MIKCGIKFISLTALNYAQPAQKSANSGEKMTQEIREVDTKYARIIQKRRSRSAWSLGVFMNNLWRFSIVPRIARTLSVLLRYSFLRGRYVSLMNSRVSSKKLKGWMGSGIRRAVVARPELSEVFKTGKALILYYSISGNTEKVAMAIQEGVKQAGLEPVVKKVSEAEGEDLYAYDLVCIGTPVVHGLPPHPVMKYILEVGYDYRARGFVGLNSFRIPGKKAVVFVTYSGPHIGVKEALPAGVYLSQSLEHLGFDTEEWYEIGEFHGWKDGSTKGRLGDIRGRPNAEDLARIEKRTIELVRSISTGSVGSAVGQSDVNGV